MRRRDALSVIDILFGLTAVAGAAAGSVYGFAKYGVVGAVVGVPAGLVAGGAAAIVLAVCVAAVVFVAVVAWTFLTEGRSGVREMFRDPLPEPGDCHGDGK